MDPYIQGAMLLVVAGMAGTFCLAGLRLKLKAREPDRSAVTSEEFERLIDSVEQLSDQVASLTNETADLQDRVEFAERLLAAPRDPVNTPV